ncbi:class I SAM-dependent methyltransferase [Salinicoccus halodurans]|uniref:AdoMet-dependent methyltransferase n=1 Tax=Salinicoccus halodurans TaxID=407035 RepID=A0A0F7D4A8_9STAP|nr:class I SAM-dependent methyltransferase [Salinicoccus halodurans]AKG73910.1 SAM-dependent methyltransferase [Salinicoccus halodurans]SFK57633.1 putative AdoMet-dependent methyltransferase [Salinicoccus halodurans]
MLSNKGFDLWADDYDKTVQISEENNLYPFAGYKEILNLIFNEVMSNGKSKVLDIGFGTGVLSSRIYGNAHEVHGIDFSSGMHSIAEEKMPEANLVLWDISEGLPTEVSAESYDFIISTYTLHHLNDEDRYIFINDLMSHLKENGKLLIGDISFETREKSDRCRQDNIDYWDEDEIYFVSDEIGDRLKMVYRYEYKQVSHCGGLYVLENY